jgi:hypothetical protein
MSMSFGDYGFALCGCPLCAGSGSGFSALATGTTATGTLPSLTTAQAAEQITRAGPNGEIYSWTGTYGQPATVTYAFRANTPWSGYGDELVPGQPDLFEPPSGFQQLNSAQMQAVEAGIAYWSDVANISFARQGTGAFGMPGYTDSAQVLIGTYAENDGANGWAIRPSSANLSFGTTTWSAVGDLWLNRTYGDLFINTAGSYGRLTIVHELGHVIGLDHPGDYNLTAGAPEYQEDTWEYTVMSYFEAWNSGASHVGWDGSYVYPSTPLLHDIAAAQRLYGANMTTRTGDTCYGFYSNTQRDAFTLTNDWDQRVFAVWDAGGYDTFNFSLYRTNAIIDLRPEHFSSVGGLTDNVAIAANVTIEAAVGGFGNDLIIGNVANNALLGGDGNDTLSGGDGTDYLDGGAGWDSAAYSGAFTQYALFRYGGTLYVYDGVTGRDGLDALVNMEVVSFDDGTALTVQRLLNQPGWSVPSAAYHTVLEGTTASLSDWFAAGSFIYGVTVVGYMVYDSSAGGGSIHTPWGAAVSGSWIWLSPDDFAASTYVGGRAGSEYVYVAAYMSDGTVSNLSYTYAYNRPHYAVVDDVQIASRLDLQGYRVALSDMFTIDNPTGAALQRHVISLDGDGAIVLADGTRLAAGGSYSLTVAEYAGAQLETGLGESRVTQYVVDAFSGASNYVTSTFGPTDVVATTATPIHLDPGQSYTGTINVAGDVDYIAVDLAPGFYTATLRGDELGHGSLDDPFLAIFDGGGTLVRQNDNATPNATLGSLDSLVVFEITAAGTYYVATSGADGGTGTYLLQLVSGATFFAPDPATTPAISPFF